MRLFTPIFLLFFSLSSSIFCEQILLDSTLQKAMKFYNNGELLEAYQDLKEYFSENPEDLKSSFLLALVKFKMMWLAPYTEGDREELLHLLKKVENLAEPDLETDKEALFFYSAAQGIRAQLAATEGSWWTTAQMGKRMKEGAETLVRKYPEFYESYYLLGSFNYFADVLPAYIKFFRSLLFVPGGNRTEGLTELLIAYEKASLASEEAGRTLALIYTYYEKHHRYGKQMCDLLLHRSPDNIEVGLYKGINLYYEGEFEESLVWLTQLRQCIHQYSRKHNGKENHAVVSIYYPVERQIRYWMCRNLIQLQQYGRAMEMLKELADPELHEPYWIQRGVFLSMAYIHYLQKEPEKAEARIARVLRWSDIQNSHQKARLLKKKKEKIGKFDIDFLL